MKYVFILAIIALLALVSCSGGIDPQATGAGSTIPEGFGGSKAIDISQSVLEFEGYAIGKSHVGTFTDWSGEFTITDGQITGAKGVILASSVDMGIESLNNHLKSDDFFDVTTYPKISIQSTALANGMMTAELTFRGITKSIEFPVTVTKNSLSTDFLLDTSDFAMKYIGVKSDVRIAFTMVV